MAAPIEPPTESLQEPVASRETAISCLVRLGVQNGIDIEIETVRRRTVRDGDRLTVSRLIKLADEFGLQAEWSRLDWQGLKTTGFSRALLVFWTNSNAVLLTGGGRAGGEEVSIWDPHHDGVIFYVPREEFERSWNGHALIVTPKEQGKTFAPQPQQGGKAAMVSDMGDKASPAPANIVKKELLLNPLPGATPSRTAHPAGTQLRSRRRLLASASVAVVATASVAIFVLVHAGTDDTLARGTLTRADASGSTQGATSAGKTAAGPSAASASSSTPAQADAAIATPAADEARGRRLPDAARPAIAPEPEVDSTHARPELAALAAGHTLSPAPAPAAPSFGGDTSAATSVTTPLAGPRLSAADLAALLARGDVLFSKGDLIAARLFYERAADAGEGQAALRLGETFDPDFLDQARLRGARGDLSTALSWYRRARDLGVAEAEILLKSLETKQQR
jgi:peptidase C39-like protein